MNFRDQLKTLRDMIRLNEPDDEIDIKREEVIYLAIHAHDTMYWALIIMMSVLTYPLQALLTKIYVKWTMRKWEFQTSHYVDIF
jgi:hypothetical protein